MEHKTIKVEFILERGLNRKPLQEVVAIEVPAEFTEEQITEEIRLQFNEWIFNNIDAGWEIIDEEV